ncbi:DUF1491 family protein [Methyloceanibacter sp.]|uniref:DUF1491 family protein n=1 Tax=Methyloceanibacter sp. TaxID=1965321 RepID=UPI003F50A51D
MPVVVVRRGDTEAGAIFISIDRLDGTVCLYGPAPAGLEGSDTDRRWVRCLEGRAATPQEVSIYLARQIEFDPDLWVIEVEDKAGRHFLNDDLVRA